MVRPEGAMMDSNILVDIYFEADATRESPGMLHGILATFGEVATDRPDVFDVGSLVWDIDGFILNEQHNRLAPVKRVVPTLEGDTIRLDVALPNTQRGRDMAVMVADRTLTGLSVELDKSSIRAQYRNGRRHITHAKVVAAALVDKAAFTGSTVEVHEYTSANVTRCLPWL